MLQRSTALTNSLTRSYKQGKTLGIKKFRLYFCADSLASKESLCRLVLFLRNIAKTYFDVYCIKAWEVV